MSVKTFRIYGLIIVILMTYVHYTGWSWTDVDEVKNVPHTVRSNPGSYRDHYHTYIRISGGK